MPAGAISARMASSNPSLTRVIGTKIKFGQITLQVLFSTMLVCADHSAFEYGKEAFQRIGVDRIADIFLADIDSFTFGDIYSPATAIQAGFIPTRQKAISAS
jgi:hypothetical protein